MRISATVNKLVIGGGYWFVSCIMLYYIVLWFVRKYAEHKPLIPFVLCSVGVIVWYCLLDRNGYALYGNNYFKWSFFFLFMLAGAYVGNGTIKMKTRPWVDVALLVLSVLLFYGIQILEDKNSLMAQLQILTVLPLLGVVFYTYKLCCLEGAEKLMHTKVGWFIQFLAGLCLESYIVQVTIIPLMANKLSFSIPVNLLITAVLVIVAAYVTRCLGRVFSQIFENDDINWKKVFELVG